MLLALADGETVGSGDAVLDGLCVASTVGLVVVLRLVVTSPDGVHVKDCVQDTLPDAVASTVDEPEGESDSAGLALAVGDGELEGDAERVRERVALELMELLRLGDSLRVALRDPVAEPLTLFDCDPLLVAPERERDSEALTEPLRERLCVADGE